MSPSATGRYCDMSEPFPNQNAGKSPWPRRLAMGCGGVVLLAFAAIIVTNIIIKNYVAKRLEKELASKGLQAEIGGFDYSILSKEITIKDFSTVHMAPDDFEKFEVAVIDKEGMFIGEDGDVQGWQSRKQINQLIEIWS